MLKKAIFFIISTALLLIIAQKLQAQMVSSSIGATAVDHPDGARLESVSSSGRASRFGLRQGDIVLTINGQTVKDATSFLTLMNGVARGAAVSIKVVRNNAETTVGRTSTFGGGRDRMGGGRGGRGGGRRSGTTMLVESFDKDGNGWLNKEERDAIRRPSGVRTSGTYNPMLKPEDVQWYSEQQPLYDIQTLRTIFLEFENEDWEAELEYFYHTDVEVPAKMIVDGRTYQNVGVRFRGNTSYSMVGTGWKRPLNLTMDFIENKQYLYGYRTLNLLNSVSDPTFLRQVLYQQIARQYIPALKANYIRLVINGENWGIYINMQQFNTDFIKDEFDTRKGARWKVPQMSSGGGLTYMGDNIQSYKNTYEIKSKDDPNSWADLVNLCKVLNQTPADRLEEALEPILDIDGTLKFLALDKALVNNDGYWTRASDYLLYQDKDGRFHIIPYDTSETMSGSGGGGRGRGGFGGGGGVRLDPFAGAYDSGKPLLSKLLSVPSLRQRYLGYIRDIAENWLDWDKIHPIAQQYQSMIAADIQTDQRKLDTTAAFFSDLAIGSSGMSLKSFIIQRREYLLSLPQVDQAALP